MAEVLFHKFELRSALEQQKEKLKQEVHGFQGDYLLTVSEDDVQRFLLEKYQVEVPVLLPDQATSTGAQDAEIDVSRDRMRMILDRSRPFYLKGTRVTINVPFSGDRELFFAHPSTYNTNPPHASVTEHEVVFSFTQVEPPAKLKVAYEQELHSIQEYLKFVRSDMEAFNKALPGFITEVVQHRKRKLLKDRNLEAALGIPLTRAAEPSTVPVAKRKPPVKPQPKTTGFTPEPTVPAEEYDHILSVIENMVLVMERSPHAFAKMEEEALPITSWCSSTGIMKDKPRAKPSTSPAKPICSFAPMGRTPLSGNASFGVVRRNSWRLLINCLGTRRFGTPKLRSLSSIGTRSTQVCWPA